jgi:hypothetical protein
VGFVAGTPFIDVNYYELETTFNFAAMPNPSDCDTRPEYTAPCSYRYYLNVVTYETNDTVTDLWDRGQHVTSVSTYGPYFATSARELQFTVGDFGCPLIRSVAFVVTLADSVGLASTVWSNHARLDYNYSFRVKNPAPPPGYTCPAAHPKCPFVFVAGPAGLLLDNSILGEGAWHAGEVPAEPDVRDEYVLSRPVEVRDGRVQLELREEGMEESTLDAARLVAYDVPEGMRLARRMPGSTVGWVSGAMSPATVLDRQGRDVTAAVRELDGESVEGIAGDFVEFDWVKSTSIGIEIIVLDPLLKQPPPGGWSGPPSDFAGNGGRAGIVMQARVDGEWVDLIEFVPRERGESQCVETSVLPGHPGDTVRIRLRWAAEHRLDRIGVGHWTEAEGTTLELVAATHSTRGDVRPGLSAADGTCETLGPRERIAMTFGGYVQEPRRQLCLVTQGHYVIPRGFVGGGQQAEPNIRVNDTPVGSVPSIGSPSVTVFPNPSRGPVTLEVALAAAERVEAAIYSIDGRLIRKLEGGLFAAGANRLSWDGRNQSGLAMPSGQYYFEVRGGAWEKSGKLFVIR